jgi:hypothetical protein
MKTFTKFEVQNLPMKKTIATIALLIASIEFQAQASSEPTLPSAVKAAFDKRHPQVSTAKWEKEKGNYEAGFVLMGKEHSELYDTKGVLVEEEVEIGITELPAKARDYIIAHGGISGVKEASKITGKGNKICYEAEVGNQDLIFDDAGQFLRAEKSGSDKED